MNVPDIKHLFDYTEWANARTIDAAKQLSDEHLRRDVGISHKSIFETLAYGGRGMDLAGTLEWSVSGKRCLVTLVNGIVR